MEARHCSTPWGVASTCLGRGALAEVYLLLPEGQQQPATAVKVMRKPVVVFLQAVQAVVQERLALEAACAGEAPVGIAALLATAHDDKYLYLRLEAVLATSSTSVQLRALLRARPSGLPPPYVACLTARVVGALVQLHARGVVNRDLKPENLVLDADGGIASTTR